MYCFSNKRVEERNFIVKMIMGEVGVIFGEKYTLTDSKETT